MKGMKDKRAKFLGSLESVKEDRSLFQATIMQLSVARSLNLTFLFENHLTWRFSFEELGDKSKEYLIPIHSIRKSEIHLQ